MKQPVLRALLFVVFPFFFSSPELVCGAEVYQTTTLVTKKQAIRIDGEIDRITVDRAIALADHSNITNFSLNSGGGDVEVSMKLGRYFRRKEVEVIIEGSIQNGICASSCLFLLAGAVSRHLFVYDNPDAYPGPAAARIGVHRPFTTKDSSSTSVSSREYTRLNRAIKEYLTEMNITESLLDQMNSVPPNEVKWLRQSEVAFYFPSDDPGFLDQKYSRIAARRGITKTEYIRRLQRIDQECSKSDLLEDNRQQIERYAKCHNDILSGLR